MRFIIYLCRLYEPSIFQSQYSWKFLHALVQSFWVSKDEIEISNLLSFSIDGSSIKWKFFVTFSILNLKFSWVNLGKFQKSYKISTWNKLSTLLIKFNKIKVLDIFTNPLSLHLFSCSESWWGVIQFWMAWKTLLKLCSYNFHET